MSTSVEKIKERLSIEEVVGKYIKIEKAGANFKARCPFHNEKTPSFFISTGRGTYYCFGCGAKGDIFSFVEQFEGLDFKGALRVLAGLAGVVLEMENPKERSERDLLFSVLAEATTFYESCLAKNAGARDYLKGRGLTEETIREWRIGFAPAEWRTLFEHFASKKVPASLLFKAGLIKEPARGGDNPYDTFRGRVMFPIFDTSGRIIAFSGRILPSLDDGKVAKYLNSPDTALFNKSKTLYGFDKAKLAIRLKDYTILVEGQMDLLMAHQAGCTNTVATSGTALTEEHLLMLKKLSPNLLMAYDADKAGQGATERGWKLALRAGLAVKVATLPAGMDPADMISHNIEGWKQALRSSEHIIEAHIRRLEAEQLSQKDAAKRFREKILPLLASVESPAERSRYISQYKLSLLTGIREEAIWEELRRVPAAASEEALKTSTAQKPGRNLLIEKIFGLLFLLESTHTGNRVGELRQELVRVVGQEEMDRFRRDAEAKRGELLFEAEVSYADETARLSALRDFILRFEEERVREEFGAVMQQLYKAEQGKDAAEAEKLLKRCQELGEKLVLLKQKLSFT